MTASCKTAFLSTVRRSVYGGKTWQILQSFPEVDPTALAHKSVHSCFDFQVRQHRHLYQSSRRSWSVIDQNGH